VASDKMCVVMQAPKCLVVVELMPYRRPTGADKKSVTGPWHVPDLPRYIAKTRLPVPPWVLRHWFACRLW